MRLAAAVLTLGCCLAFAAPVEVNHIAVPFQLPTSNEQFDLHVINIAPEGETGTRDGCDWLRLFASHVEADAHTNGYLNANTEGPYQEELSLLRDGRMPTTFITPRGGKEILLGFSFAIRWGNDPLPVEKRFFGKGIPGIPDEIPAKEIVGIGQPRQYWHLFPELNVAQSADFWGLMQLRPSIEGEKAEIKFLVGSDPNPMRFMRIIHESSMMFELHRNSRIKPSAESLKEYWNGIDRLTRPRLPSPAQRRLLLPNQPIWDYLYENLFSESWQPTVRNSHLYVHVSGKPVQGHRQSTARAYAFVHRMGFPEVPRWSLKETERTGTPGIHTDIFELSLGHYEWIVDAELRKHPRLELSEPFPRPDDPRFCRGILSRVEAGLLEAGRLY